MELAEVGVKIERCLAYATSKPVSMLPTMVAFVMVLPLPRVALMLIVCVIVTIPCLTVHVP